ncbi:hypothetical protein PsorP6_000734 [Peronosclerospora sorghi]|uniref:Uncharacterized protein n=1 Tax=Peronosclerospora sorghi TaxID=230839 RepID=A0ACC0WV52_9STRA|nr:hypothetical protein PsorP6_000734 [Peronosclerospora sorghi]
MYFLPPSPEHEKTIVASLPPIDQVHPVTKATLSCQVVRITHPVKYMWRCVFCTSSCIGSIFASHQAERALTGIYCWRAWLRENRHTTRHAIAPKTNTYQTQNKSFRLLYDHCFPPPCRLYRSMLHQCGPDSFHVVRYPDWNREYA